MKMRPNGFLEKITLHLDEGKGYNLHAAVETGYYDPELSQPCRRRVFTVKIFVRNSRQGPLLSKVLRY